MDIVSGGVQAGTTEGGAACNAFMPLEWRVAESAVGSAAAVALHWHFCRQREPALGRLLVSRHGCGSVARSRHWLQYPVAAALWFCFLAQVAYKTLARQIVFMLQPCHVITVSLAVSASLPRRDPRGEMLLLNMLGWIFGPLLALASPDTTNLRLPGEIALFWFQHLALAATPFVLFSITHAHVPAALGSLRQSLGAQMAGYFFNVVLHYVVYGPITWASWANLDYQLCPPDAKLPGVGTVVPELLYRPWTAFVIMAATSWLCSAQHLKLAALCRQGAAQAMPVDKTTWYPPPQVTKVKPDGDDVAHSNLHLG